MKRRSIKLVYKIGLNADIMTLLIYYCFLSSFPVLSMLISCVLSTDMWLTLIEIDWSTHWQWDPVLEQTKNVATIATCVRWPHLFDRDWI